MSALSILVIILVGSYTLIAPGLGIWAFAQAMRNRDKIDLLGRRLAAIGPQIETLRTEIEALRPIFGAPSQSAADESAAPPEAGEAEPGEEAPPETEDPPGAQDTPEVQDTPPQSPIPESPPQAAAARLAAPLRNLEEQLTSRWLVWLGAVTLALAGIFLVRYSIERGLLGPEVRVSLGFLMGLVLVVFGEWLRRRPVQRAIAAVRPDYVPRALTAAGLFSAFASVYSAHALYGLLGPVAGFALLAAIAGGAVALALLQGPFVALLGLLGGFLTPLLVSTDAPSAWALFGYLLVLVAGALTLVRTMSWWWLAWTTLGGAALWPLYWFSTQWSPGDAVSIGIYLTLLAALFFFFRREDGPSEGIVNSPIFAEPLAVPDQIVWIAACVIAGLTFALVRMDAYGTPSLITLAILSVGFLGIARREPSFDGLAVVAAILTVALMAAWHLPEIVSKQAPWFTLSGRGYGQLPGPILPPELLPFAAVSTAFGALFGLGGFVALWGARRPALWAAVSTATPVLLLVAAYWRITAFQVDLKWAVLALLLAGISLAAASRMERYRARPGLKAGLGVYAAGVISAISLAATMTLEQAWLTVALSLQLPALAWIDDHLKLKHLRTLAGAVAAVVLVRLVLNFYVLDYPLGEVPALNWILYGYGIPAAAFFLAARHYRRAGDDRLATGLEAGALAFAALLVTFEIRSIVVGPLDSSDHPLLEQSLQSIAWLAMAYGLQALHRRHGGLVPLWGWRVLAGLAAIQVLVFQTIGSSPLWTSAPIGEFVVLDMLFLAYAVPAGFAFFFARALREDGYDKLALAAALIGLAQVFVYLSLEVRHVFHGSVLTTGGTTDLELYSYSAVWLGYAGALLALALRSGSTGLRYASLVMLLVTVGKVFLADMSALTGLYRVASFLGLGLSLVAIGYIYQRYVFPRSGRPSASGVSEPERGPEPEGEG